MTPHQERGTSSKGPWSHDARPLQAPRVGPCEYPVPPNRALKPTVPFGTGLAGWTCARHFSARGVDEHTTGHGRKQDPRRTVGGPAAPDGRTGGLALALGGPCFSFCNVILVYAETIAPKPRWCAGGSALADCAPGRHSIRRSDNCEDEGGVPAIYLSRAAPLGTTNFAARKAPYSRRAAEKVINASQAPDCRPNRSKGIGMTQVKIRRWCPRAPSPRSPAIPRAPSTAWANRTEWATLRHNSTSIEWSNSTVSVCVVQHSVVRT